MHPIEQAEAKEYFPRTEKRRSICTFMGRDSVVVEPTADDEHCGNNAGLRRTNDSEVAIVSSIHESAIGEPLSPGDTEEIIRKYRYFLELHRIGAIPKNLVPSLFFIRRDEKSIKYSRIASLSEEPPKSEIVNYRLVVQYLPGVSLNDYCRNVMHLFGGYYSNSVVLFLLPLYEIWRKFNFIHRETGLVHEGSHGENWLVKFDSDTNAVIVNVIDGGYSRAAGDPVRRFTHLERRYYQAPELFLYGATASINQDIYALAKTCFFALGNGSGDEDSFALSTIKLRASNVIEILKRATADDPRKRPTSGEIIAEFEKTLAKILNSLLTSVGRADDKKCNITENRLRTIHLLLNSGIRPDEQELDLARNVKDIRLTNLLRMFFPVKIKTHLPVIDEAKKHEKHEKPKKQGFWCWPNLRKIEKQASTTPKILGTDKSDVPALPDIREHIHSLARNALGF